MSPDIAGSISTLELRLTQVEQNYVNSILPLTRKVEQALSQIQDTQVKVMNQTREIQAVHEEAQLSAKVQSNFRSEIMLRLETVKQGNEVSQQRSLTLCKSLAEQIVGLKQELAEVTEHVKKTIASSYQQNMEANAEWSNLAANESEKQRVMFSKRFQELQKLVNQTNRLVNENIEELLKQSKQQRRKIDDFEANMQKFLMGYVSTVKGKIKDIQIKLDQLTRVVAAEIRDRKQNQEGLEEKLGEIENKSEGCIENQIKEIKETYAFFAKQMEQILEDTHKALEFKRSSKGTSHDELKAFEKRYAKDMETLFYLVSSLGDGDVANLPQSGEDFMKKLQREEPLLQPTRSVKQRFSPTKHIPLDITLSDSNSETCDAERALTKFLQEGSPSIEKEKVIEQKHLRLPPKEDSVKEQLRPISQMSRVSNLERKCTTHFAAEDVNVAELFASGPIDPQTSKRLLDSNYLQCVGDLPAVENTQVLRTSPVFLTPIPAHKRLTTTIKSVPRKLDLKEIGNQKVQQKTAPNTVAQNRALSNRSQKRSIDLPALKSHRSEAEVPNRNASDSESVVARDPISDKYPVRVLPASDNEEQTDTDNQLEAAETAFGLNADFDKIGESLGDSVNVSLPKTPLTSYSDREADDLKLSTKPNASPPETTILNEQESNNAPYEDEDFEEPQISDDPFEGLLDDTVSEDDGLQQTNRPVSSGAGKLEDVKIEETPNHFEEQKSTPH